jgi:phytoene synthase
VVRAEDGALLDGLVAARRWDIYKDAFEDAAHFERYLDATGGNLDWVAARALGAPDGAESAVRDAAWAAALARFLRAVPELEARGRIPLVDGRVEAVVALGGRGVGTDRACAACARASSGRGGRALFSGWQAETLLHQARTDPTSVAEGRMAMGAFAASWRLARMSLTGRW